MVKRIKNWDKLNKTHINHLGTFYEILTDKVIETDTESEYQFGIWDLKTLIIKGRLVITQAKMRNLTNSKGELVNEYVLTIRCNISSKFITQHMLSDESVSNLNIFTFCLTDMCKHMLYKINETQLWRAQSGYTI